MLLPLSDYIWPTGLPSQSYGQRIKAELLASGMETDCPDTKFTAPNAELWLKKHGGNPEYVAVDIRDHNTISQLKACSSIFEHLIKGAVAQTRPNVSLKLLNGYSCGTDASHWHVKSMTLEFEMSKVAEGAPSVQWIDGADTWDPRYRHMWAQTADFGLSKLAAMSADDEDRLERSIGAGIQDAFEDFLEKSPERHSKLKREEGYGQDICGDYTWKSWVGPGKSGDQSITFKLHLACNNTPPSTQLYTSVSVSSH